MVTWSSHTSTQVNRDRLGLFEPSVSVIIPVRNEARFIESSLGAVLRQDYPADKMENIIADGMSSDQTAVLIQQMTSFQRLRIVSTIDKIKQLA